MSDLSRLSHEEDRQIRRMVASNPRTPASDLARLAGDESHVVRVRVAANSSTDPQVLRRLSEEDGVVGVAALRTIQEQG